MLFGYIRKNVIKLFCRRLKVCIEIDDSPTHFLFWIQLDILLRHTVVVYKVVFVGQMRFWTTEMSD